MHRDDQLFLWMTRARTCTRRPELLDKVNRLITTVPCSASKSGHLGAHGDVALREAERNTVNAWAIAIA